MTSRLRKEPCVIAHIVFRFDYGGLENGVCNLINSLSDEELRHTVIALTDATSFRERLRSDVPVHEIKKKPGKDLGAYVRLFRLLRNIQPEIVHTRNIGTMDCAVIALLAGVPIRIHGEHGWDVSDPDGTNPKYRLMRRLLSRFVHRFVTVSADLRDWLVEVVRIAPKKIVQIYNGVDIERFRPASQDDVPALPADINAAEAFVIGSVTRFSAIKDPLNLVNAWLMLSERLSGTEREPYLIMLGSGPLFDQARATLEKHAPGGRWYLPGSSDDVADIMRHFDLFVLGSLREGISNTILEAMASGLPVVASDTGGNVELVSAGSNGQLVPPGDTAALADAIAAYVCDLNLATSHGAAARERAESRFSIHSMVRNYRNLYAEMLRAKGFIACVE